MSYMEGYNMTILRMVMWLLSFAMALLGLIIAIEIPDLRVVGLVLTILGIYRFIYVTEQFNNL